MLFEFTAPFALSAVQFLLTPGADRTFEVMFHPGFTTDFISEVIVRRIAISFNGHPQCLFVWL
jgi:hypothetical protein